jgi:hypothetical protein
MDLTERCFQTVEHVTESRPSDVTAKTTDIRAIDPAT